MTEPPITYKNQPGLITVDRNGARSVNLAMLARTEKFRAQLLAIREMRRRLAKKEQSND